MSDIRVRFAPSPTGVLHLGGARTALFNWLWARNQGGKFLLRIEDTDRERSTEESTQAILDALTWLGMSWDEEPIYQSSRVAEHKEALEKLIAMGCVYKCYCTPEDRKVMREKALAEGRTAQYDGRCDGKLDDPSTPFVWRFRMPKNGETILDDKVMGKIATPNQELEDLVIARSDGSPLYNFAVVVDDAAMGVTHVIRGKDHLTNTPKQIQIYKALDLKVPQFAHLPLILGLSKRLRSAGIESYRKQGYLPEAVNNYIVRLGWSHGDQEVFSPNELVDLFKLDDVNRSEGSLNLEKMEWLNHQHIQVCKQERLAELTAPFLAEIGVEVDPKDPKLIAACESRRTKSRTLIQMAEGIKFFFVDDDVLEYDEKAVEKHLNEEARQRLKALATALSEVEDWSEEQLHHRVNAFCEEGGIKLKNVAQPCRVALTGTKTGPGLFEMMAVLGQNSTLARFHRAIAKD
ncbi:MAG: glutamate--tRNA ligase [Proteobacteria bacterium]|nr:glutamate--tRNA ligase [Pseudomonadota bacterium]